MDGNVPGSRARAHESDAQLTFTREAVTDAEVLRETLRSRHPQLRDAVDAAVMATCCIAGGDIGRLVVFSFVYAARPAGFLIALAEPSSIAARVGRMTLATRSISRLRVPGDRAVVWDESVFPLARAAGEIAVAMSADSETVLMLQSVVARGTLELMAARLRSSRSRSAGYAEEAQDRFLTVTDLSYEKYFESLSAGTRESYKRTQRKLLKSMDGQVRQERFERPEDVERFFALAEGISRQTYQWQELGLGMKQREFVLRRLHLAAKLGFMRCYVFFCRDQPVAFWEGYAAGRVFLAYQTGYLPSMNKLSVGTVHTLEVVRDILSVDGTSWCIDWMSGGSDYKRRLSTTSIEECSLYLIPRRMHWMPYAASLAVSHAINTYGASFRNWLKSRKAHAVAWIGYVAPVLQALDDGVCVDCLY